MRTRNHSILWALLLIAIGVVLLLRNSGAIDEDVRIWPLVVMAVGAWLLVDRIAFGGRLGGGFVWPLVLVAIGGVFSLQDTGTFGEDVSLWPVILIAIGVGIVLSAAPGRRVPPVTSESVPLGGATSARVVIDHGAGRLSVRSTLGPGTLLEGMFVGGAEPKVRRDGERVEVTLRHRAAPWLDYAFPWNWGRAAPFDWTVGLSRRVPLSLALDSGADHAELDLSDLQVHELSIDTGASRTDLTLPTRGRTGARIKAGAAKISVRVPDQVAARIVVRGGVSSVRVDRVRFPPYVGGYQSPDYDAVEDRVDLTIEAGAADVEVR